MTTTTTFTYNGFTFATLADAEQARKRDDGGWYDGRRRVIWGPHGEAF